MRYFSLGAAYGLLPLTTEPPVLFLGIVVSHSGNVVAHHAVQRLMQHLLLVAGGQLLRAFHEEGKYLGNGPLGFLLVSFSARAGVGVLIQKGLNLAALLFHLRAE